MGNSTFIGNFILFLGNSTCISNSTFISNPTFVGNFTFISNSSFIGNSTFSGNSSFWAVQYFRSNSTFIGDFTSGYQFHFCCMVLHNIRHPYCLFLSLSCCFSFCKFISCLYTEHHRRDET